MRIFHSSLVASAVALAAATPLAAEVVEASEGHFVTRNQAVVEAGLTETWLALISPARWWSSEHTWSADAANLTLTPQAGGCFCETIPEVNEPDRFTLEGSVEHMRVLQAYPEVALRMSGALGPLQSEPVTGILTIALSEVELDLEADPETGTDANTVSGTRIVWEYNVGGHMRYPIPVISTAVDGVMTLQLTRLSDSLGTLVKPTEPPPPPQPESEPEVGPGDGEADGVEEAPAEADSGEAMTIDPETVLEEPQDEEERGPSVDEAFDDLGDPG